jgi:DNA repair protein RecN (Recombination protein N)
VLAALHIENIAVIKELDLDFSRGLTVLTGETGAGKSIVIGSLRMLLGAKTDRDLIRSGETEALVEGLFTAIEDDARIRLEQEGISPDENGELLLMRSLTAEGRNACKINGRTVPLSKLKAAGQILLAIHGQHDTQTLLKSETHIDLLDRFADCESQLAVYKEAYGRSVALKSRLAALLKDEGQKELTVKELKAAVREISEAKLKAGEDEELEGRKRVVRDAQKLAKQSRIVYRALYKNEKGGSASDLIEIASTAMEQLSEVLEGSEDYIARLTACKLELEEIARSAYSVCELCTDNPAEELNRIEDRLDLIKALKKKYGPELSDVIAFEENAKEKLRQYEGRDREIASLKEELAYSVEEARRHAAILTDIRQKGADVLEEAVNRQVRYLDLEKVTFSVSIVEERFEKGPPKLSANGKDSVSFMIVTNPGEPPKPLSDIASGGELSRIMLALKVALADKELTPTLIFDEIDTGISGKTSQKIGIKLREIGGYTQVFCITHSAQVAASGHHHFKITKTEVEGRNRTQVELLDGQGRVGELARIMGGIHITKAILDGAEELLKDGQQQG